MNRKLSGALPHSIWRIGISLTYSATAQSVTTSLDVAAMNVDVNTHQLFIELVNQAAKAAVAYSLR